MKDLEQHSLLIAASTAVALLGASTASASVTSVFGKDALGDLKVSQPGSLDSDLLGTLSNAGATAPAIIQNVFGPQVLFGAPGIFTNVSFRAFQFTGETPTFAINFPNTPQTSIAAGNDTGGILNGGIGPTAFGIDAVRFDNDTAGVQILSSMATYGIQFNDVPFGNSFFGTYALADSGGQTVTLSNGMAAVPLPAGAILLLSGLGGLAIVRQTCSRNG